MIFDTKGHRLAKQGNHLCISVVVLLRSVCRGKVAVEGSGDSRRYPRLKTVDLKGAHIFQLVHKPT